MGFLSKIFGREARTERLGSGDRKEPIPNSTDIWSFGPFSMVGIPEFSYFNGQAPAVYGNAAGDLAMITVNVLNGKPPPAEAAEIFNRAISHAGKVFDSAAEKFGVARSDPSKRLLESGDTLLSYPVSTSEQEGKGYLLQYAVVAPAGHITIITVEGRGDAGAAAATMEKSVATARFAV